MTPKSLVPVGGRPFLELQLALLSRNGVDDVVMCVGHMADAIASFVEGGERSGIRVRLSRESQRLDTGGALKNAMSLLDREFMVLYGDSYLTIDFAGVEAAYRESACEGLMTVFHNRGELEPSTIVVRDGLVRSFDKADPAPSAEWMEYGLNVLRRDLLDTVDASAFPISEYFRVLIERQSLAAYEASERFYEIGSHQGIADLERYLADRSAPAATEATR